MRRSGMLLPIASLPSPYGIGAFSKEAYEFIDLLRDTGQKLWQILPLGPTSYGDSPYQSFSTFAGNPYFIDLNVLIGKGWLTKEECDACDWGDHPSYIDYGKIYESRFPLLRKAFERSKILSDGNFLTFCVENNHWLDDYALYMAVKNKFGGKSWIEWDEEVRLREPAALKRYQDELREDIIFYQYLQFEFFEQWKNVKNYAHEKGIQIVGDIPIYVAFDSADTWANRRTGSLPQASSGAIPCTAGITTRECTTAGGCAGLPTVSSFLTLCGLTISGDLMSIIPFPTEMRPHRTATGKRDRAWTCSIP